MRKIAIVYDWIDKWGGVERVLLTLHEMFPEVQFYTSYYESKKALWAKNLDVKTSFIQKLPIFIKRSRILSFPFYPFAFESFDFSNYDVVISVTSSFAKSIITKPKTLHICYLLTPTRYLWVMPKEYGAPTINYLKKWDFVAAQRPDKIISISKTVQERCRKYYQRDSEVIYPPFDVEYWNNLKVKSQKSKTQVKTKKFFLIVSRLEPYKRVDLAIKVFNGLKNERLVIIGDGTERQKLQEQANSNIAFISYLPDEELAQYYMNAKALIMPQEEDFGYISLEAQFFGCPVIAYNKGGARETVIENRTGLFFAKQSERSLGEALARFHILSYNLRTSTKMLGVKLAEKFAKNDFMRKFPTLL